MRDFTEQLEPFIRNESGFPYYDSSIDKFLREIKPLDGEIVVYKEFSSFRRYLQPLRDLIPSNYVYQSDGNCLMSTSISNGNLKYAMAYQQGKTSTPVLPNSKLFAHREPRPRFYRCLAPANSQHLDYARIPPADMVQGSWDKGNLIQSKEGDVYYAQKDIFLCEWVTVLDQINGDDDAAFC